MEGGPGRRPRWLWRASESRAGTCPSEGGACAHKHHRLSHWRPLTWSSIRIFEAMEGGGGNDVR
eukprot:5962184-Alexandrium_andersonii.AAC.1